MKNVKAEKNSKAAKFSEEQLVLTPAQNFKFGFVPIPAIDPEDPKKKGKIVEDMIRGDIFDESILASKCKKAFQEGKRENNIVLIKDYFSQRYGVKFSDKALQAFDQKLWTSIFMQMNEVVIQEKGYTIGAGSKKVSLGTSGGSVYAVVDLENFVQKFPLTSHTQTQIKNINGGLRLVYKIDDKTGDFHPVGYNATGQVVDQLRELEALQASQLEEDKKLGATTPKQDASKTLELNLKVKPALPPRSGFFQTCGIFCSKCVEFFWNKFNRSRVEPTSKPAIPVVDHKKPITPASYSHILSDQKIASATNEVSNNNIQPKTAKPVQKRSFFNSLCGCFRSAKTQNKGSIVDKDVKVVSHRPL